MPNVKHFGVLNFEFIYVANFIGFCKSGLIKGEVRRFVHPAISFSRLRARITASPTKKLKEIEKMVGARIGKFFVKFPSP